VPLLAALTSFIIAVIENSVTTADTKNKIRIVFSYPVFKVKQNFLTMLKLISVSGCWICYN